MLKIPGESARDCDGLTRRSFLQVGTLGLGGLALPEFFRIRAEGADRGVGRIGGAQRSVILFWLSGGPGPHGDLGPQARRPRPVPRAVRRRSPRALPGVHFGELLPEQAEADGSAGGPPDRQPRHGRPHQGQPLDAHRLRGPRLQRAGQPTSSDGRRWDRWWPALRGGDRPGMPPYVAVPHLRGGTDNLFHYAAYLGGGGQPVHRRVRPERREVPGPEPDPAPRRLVRPPRGPPPDARRLDRPPPRRRRQAAATWTPTSSAPSTCSPAASVADGLRHRRRGPEALRDRYGRHTFGQSALLARRLVEAGTPFVTVNCVPWDHHGTPPQLKTEEGANKLIPPLDRAIARPDRRPDRPRPVRLDARRGDGRVRPHAPDEQGRRPRPLGPHLQRADGLRIDADGPGHRPQRRPRRARRRPPARAPRTSPRPSTTTSASTPDPSPSTDCAGRPTYLIDKGEPIRELVG